MLLDLTKIPYKTSLDRRLLILGYELGQVMRSAVYGQVTQQGEDVEKAHFANIRIETADLLVQLRLLAQEQEWSWTQLLIDGEERFYERMTELREKKI